MDTIYITGHRNPDTDSIVSAMAYAALKNALGQRQYEAARLGQISDETQTVLDRFGFQPPKLLNNVRTQVRDLDYDTPATLSAAATISRAWRTMQKDKISAIPVANEDGTLFGMLSAGDVANYDMSSVRILFFPDNCNSSTRTIPPSTYTSKKVFPSVRTSPAGRLWLCRILAALNILSVNTPPSFPTACNSVHAPGKGDKPRIWLQMVSSFPSQRIFMSSLNIFGASIASRPRSNSPWPVNG